MSPFGGGGGSPKKPAPAPILQQAVKRGSQATERFKRARGFDANLLSRGLLFDTPSILFPGLKGAGKKLGSGV